LSQWREIGGEKDKTGMSVAAQWATRFWSGSHPATMSRREGCKSAQNQLEVFSTDDFTN
jgi:hypothetical protein